MKAKSDIGKSFAKKGYGLFNIFLRTKKKMMKTLPKEQTVF
jgi:hypothetical protein